jgi:ATP-dependent Clp protease ATP-binding subunit ClpA
VVLLLGPTGTGKTKTVEAIAELLHGSEKEIVKLDCGEHEMAKLIGTPPGCLGHRETVPMLTQQQLTDAISEQSDLSPILRADVRSGSRIDQHCRVKNSS